MFYIDDHYYTIDDLEAQFENYETIPYLRDCQDYRLAVCLPDQFQWLSLCFYIRKKGGSVFPIHSSTPKEGALRMASNVASHYLIYESIETAIELSSDKSDGKGTLIQMSSGTTGEPKCIERTWDSVEEEVKAYAKTLSIDHLTTSIIACPITHSYGLISGVMASLERGAEPVIITNMNPKYLLKKLREQPNHILYASPTLLHTLDRLKDEKQHFNYVMTSGTIMPSKWFISLKKSSHLVLQQYGCSEAGCVTIQGQLEDVRELGYPLPHLKVKAGNETNPEEIIIETSEKIIYTKDVGYIKEGMVLFVSRVDDMINVAGLNVYPQEVEDVILNEPRIEEVVVYKKQNKLSGERVCAQFVSNEPVEGNELRDWCSKFLAPFQIPMEFTRVTEIEKLPNGKISRRKIGGVLV